MEREKGFCLRFAYLNFMLQKILSRLSRDDFETL